MSQESDSPLPPPPSAQPTRELLLAQALELCIQAERRLPGSAELVIEHQPAWARTDLRRLVALAGSLDAAVTNAVMSDEFRVAARSRLLHRIGGAPEQLSFDDAVGGWLSTVPSRTTPSARSRRSKWLRRGGGGALLAAVLVGAATLTASANALPGEPLYPVKQVREETARLLQQGRTQDVAQTTQRVEDVLARATTTLVVTVTDRAADAPTSEVESARVAAPAPPQVTQLAPTPRVLEVRTLDVRIVEPSSPPAPADEVAPEQHGATVQRQVPVAVAVEAETHAEAPPRGEAHDETPPPARIVEVSAPERAVKAAKEDHPAATAPAPASDQKQRAPQQASQPKPAAVQSKSDAHQPAPPAPQARTTSPPAESHHAASNNGDHGHGGGADHKGGD